jgi:hypothetical protein
MRILAALIVVSVIAVAAGCSNAGTSSTAKELPLAPHRIPSRDTAPGPAQR